MLGFHNFFLNHICFKLGLLILLFHEILILKNQNSFIKRMSIPKNSNLYSKIIKNSKNNKNISCLIN